MLVGAALFGSSLAGTPQINAQTPLKAGDNEFTIIVSGAMRHYIVYVPPNYVDNASLPVVIMLHGAGGSANEALSMGQWREKADKEGFFAVALDGTPLFPRLPQNFLTNPQLWNDGSGRGAPSTSKADDIGFVSTVIDNLISQAGADQKRIYVTGFSNGASMTWRVGAELATKVAAIAPVSGHLWLQAPKLDYAVSVLFIAGTADPLNPINGGPALDPWLRTNTVKPPMSDSLTAWTKALNCVGDPELILDQAGVQETAYQACDGNAKAVYYVIEGMGHNWPGGINTLPVSLVGPRSNKINATDVIWKFFQDHPKP